MIKKKYYKKIDETLYTTTLSNGLQVYIIKKKGYKGKAAYFGTRFGSLYTDDTLIDEKGRKHKILGGMAHFLEHRLFDNKRGNIMELYDALGARCNAYTSRDRTVYFFTCNNNFEESLELLLNYPLEFSMSKEAVEKEKGIIIEELKMYQDMPEEKLSKAQLSAMYEFHPIKYDIGGEIKEVEDTTLELLSLAHKRFYNPKEMVLVIVGDVDIKKTVLIIENNQKEYTNNIKLIKNSFIEKDEVLNKRVEIKDDINIDKLSFGFKFKSIDNLSKEERYKVITSINIICKILFSKSGDYYQELINKNLASSIDYGSFYYPGAFFLLLTFESNKIDKLEVRVREIIDNAFTSLTKEKLNKMKKDDFSSLVYSCDSVSVIGHYFTSYLMDGYNLFEVLELSKEIDVEYLKKVYNEYIKKASINVAILRGDNND